jgi:hypothetical protein
MAFLTMEDSRCWSGPEKQLSLWRFPLQLRHFVFLTHPSLEEP